MLSVLKGAIAIVLALGGMTLAHAQSNATNYPSKPVRLVVGLAPGGALDIFMRELAQKLTARWTQGVIVDNRVGASGALARDAVAKSPPDGHTIMAGTNAVITQFLLGQSPYDPRTAFAPIVRLSSQPYILIVNTALPVNSVRDLLALIKSKPGSLSYASSGTGAASHLGWELLQFMSGSGSTMVHVPYKGLAQAMPDLLNGRTQLMFSIGLLSGPLIKSGKIKAIAVTGRERSRNFPELPTVAESGVPGFSISSDYSLYAPAETPMAIVDLINRTSAQIMDTPEMRKRLESDGSEAVAPNTPAEFRASIEQDFVLMDRFIKASGFKGE